MKDPKDLDTNVSRAIGLLLKNSTGWVKSYRSVKIVRDLIDLWEHEVESMDEGPTREAHEQIVRLAKGQLKAWRYWLAQRKISLDQQKSVNTKNQAR